MLTFRSHAPPAHVRLRSHGHMRCRSARTALLRLARSPTIKTMQKKRKQFSFFFILNGLYDKI